MITTKRFLARSGLVAAIAIAVIAGVLTAEGQTTPRPTTVRGDGPAPATAALSQRYTACLKANGARWTLIRNSGGMYRVDIPAAANEQCASLELAREAAGQGDAAVANWLAGIGSAPAPFWSCLAAAGFHTPGGNGQRSDYGSSAFRDSAGGCAASAGVTLPTR